MRRRAGRTDPAVPKATARRRDRQHARRRCRAREQMEKTQEPIDCALNTTFRPIAPSTDTTSARPRATDSQEAALVAPTKAGSSLVRRHRRPHVERSRARSVNVRVDAPEDQRQPCREKEHRMASASPLTSGGPAGAKTCARWRSGCDGQRYTEMGGGCCSSSKNIDDAFVACAF